MKNIMLDCEMTMWMAKPRKDAHDMYVDEGNGKKYYLTSTDQELIQIGAVKLDESLNRISTFEAFVKPKCNPMLTGSCRAKTHIKQGDINSASSFEDVMNNFITWAYEDDTDIKFYSWNKEDKLQISRESKRLKFNANKILDNYSDFQLTFSRAYNEAIKNIKHLNLMLNHKDIYGLKRVADWMGIPYDESQLHGALCDANLATEIFINFHTIDLNYFINKVA